jgi:hypothetical protein
LLQHPVAGGMTATIVDALEMVEVDDGDRERRLG